MAERLSELERWRIAELSAQGSTTRLIAKEIGRGRYAVAKHFAIDASPAGPGVGAVGVAVVVE